MDLSKVGLLVLIPAIHAVQKTTTALKKCTFSECQCIWKESTNKKHNFLRDRHFTLSSEPREVLSVCKAKGVPSFLSYFKTLCIDPAPRMELATSRSAIERSTD